MPEPDVTKMKIADLKRELKLRGLLTTGNKGELLDRLQTALIEGDISLEDTAISGEDLLDGDVDAVLTDEDEAKILGADENELLKSPTTTPTTAPALTTSSPKTDDAVLEDEVPTSPVVAKKIVLKRKSSFTALGGTAATAITAGSTAKENTEPSPAKSTKMSERNPITVTTAGDAKDNVVNKVSQLSMQERLELRAKKFGITTNADASTKPKSSADGTTTTAVASAAATPAVTDEQQVELLKKRAERFGCVVSSKIAKIDADEKLQKRKQRFGGGAAITAPVNDATASTDKTNDVWAEKARQRLERFKSPATTTAATSAATVVVVDQ